MRIESRPIVGSLILLFLFLASPVSAGKLFGKKAEEPFELGSLLKARDAVAMLAALDDDTRYKVEEQFTAIVMGDSEVALQRNGSGLYPNPSIQAYVNRLGQSLIPREASANALVSFRIVQDPLPYADAQATGTVYLSTGLLSLLENESQLAFVLMHEAGHVILAHHLHQIIEEEEGIKRASRLKVIGAVAGAILGGVAGGKSDVVQGAAVGLMAGSIAGAFRNHRFLREIQFESDQFATEVLLLQGFDAREGPLVMAKIGEIVRRSGAAVDLAFGNARDLQPRSIRVSELLAGSYQPLVDRVLESEGFRMSSPRYNQLMAELKRDNGLLALERDLFAIARANLEEAAAVRTDDPLTAYGLGMLYQTVGRTDEDRAKASGFLKSAIEFDEVRHRFPEVHLQYAVELLSREDPQHYPEIQKALKEFVVLYQRKSGGSLPREMRYVYDYLDLTGDRSWISYDVNNVNTSAPYQLSGDSRLDSTRLVEAQRSPK